MSLSRKMSSAIVRAMAIYEHVSSSDQCFPGVIHGMLIMYASTISGDRFRLAMILRERYLQCIDRRLKRAPAVGINRAEAARMDVKRNADRDWTN